MKDLIKVAQRLRQLGLVEEAAFIRNASKMFPEKIPANYGREIDEEAGDLRGFSITGPKGPRESDSTFPYSELTGKAYIIEALESLADGRPQHMGNYMSSVKVLMRKKLVEEAGNESYVITPLGKKLLSFLE